MAVLEITIKGGEGRMVHSDEARPYFQAAGGEIRRATYVEPDNDGTWYVDLRRFGHGIKRGFETRKAAIDWEVAWLRENWMTFKVGDAGGAG